MRHLLLAAFLFVACGPQPGPTPTTTVMPAILATPIGSPLPAASCHMRLVDDELLPDPVCTPGAVNPDVTQENAWATICARGWTATVRPPTSYTNRLKAQQMIAYGLTGPASGYELDHLVSLELGGAPRDPRNLWPEPGRAPNVKDRTENAAHAAVCDHRLTLADAQASIATNWAALGWRLGVLKEYS